MHGLQAADGTGHDQTNRTPACLVGIRLWPHASVRRLVLLTHRRDRSQLTPFASPTGFDSTWLQVEVRLFAAAADLAAARQLTLRVPACCPLPELIQRLVEQQPALKALAHVSRWAVDEQFVSADFIVDRELAIAMIPPVSGG